MKRMRQFKPLQGSCVRNWYLVTVPTLHAFMATPTFLPPFCPLPALPQRLQQQGFAVLSSADVAQWIGCQLPDLQALQADWNHLPPDHYLKDGGRYRQRRHASFIVQGATVHPVPHRAHWQPLEYNALHGGMERWFEPIPQASLARPVWGQLLQTLGQLCTAVFSPGQTPTPWFIEAHQFRIDTTDGIGRPTPEGAHRDGVDLVAVFLVAREGVKGGETRVFEACAPAGQRFTLTQPWSLLLLDDARMIHETTPIQPEMAGGYRDTLVVTCRRSGFQDSPAAAPDA